MVISYFVVVTDLSVETDPGMDPGRTHGGVNGSAP